MAGLRQNFAAAALGVLAGTSARAQTIDWIAPGPDLWNNPIAWSALRTPLSSERAFFPTGGQCTVAAFGQCGQLYLTFGTQLTITAGATLSINAGEISNPAGRVECVGSDTESAVLTFADPAVIFDGANQFPFGQIHLNAWDESRLFSAQINNGTGGELTFQGSMEILGTGLIQADLTNNSTRGFYANITGRTLDLGGRVKRNNGLFTAINGGILRLDGVIIQGNRTGGQIVADGGIVRLDGAVITGGSISATAKGVIEVVSSGTLEGLTLDADLALPSGTSLTVRLPGIYSSGVITVNVDAGSGATSLVADSSAAVGQAVLDGPGEVALNAEHNGNLASASVTVNTGDELMLGEDHLVRGTGVLQGGGLVHNAGRIIADRPGKMLKLSCGVDNDGSIRAEPGSTLRVDTGQVIAQSPEASVEGDGATIELVRGRIIGGTIRTTPTGLFVVLPASGDPILEGLTLDGDVEIPAGETLKFRNAIEHFGRMIINSNRGLTPAFLVTDTDDDRVDGTGTIVLNAPSLSDITSARISVGNFDIFRNGPGHTIAGIGQFSGTNSQLINEGIFAPGIPDARDESIGCLSFNSVSYTQTVTGRLEIEIAGSRGLQSYDQLTLNRPVVLDGTLAVTLTPGFVPSSGDRYDIILATSVSGSFSTLDLPEVGGLNFEVQYASNQVSVVVTGCQADMNSDGTLDFFDVQAFLNLYAAQDPQADMIPDGVFDIFDLLAFLEAFSTECA